MLEKLLVSLQNLETGGKFTYSIVIADNDARMSAKKIVEEAREVSDIEIDYLVEPIQNISIARNRTVEKATGTHLAFIDDDEWPDPNWLKNHLETMVSCKADGSFGPVLPYFEGEPPRWLIEGGFCNRPSHETGTVLESTSCRTGNGLVSKDIFSSNSDRFDPKFGRSGGEDGQFFLKMIHKGSKFVWCDEAPVHEIVPPERWRASYYLRRQIRIGGVSGELERKVEMRKNPILTIVALLRMHLYLVVFTAAGLPSILVKKDLAIKCLTRASYALAFISGFFGLVLIREKNE